MHTKDIEFGVAEKKDELKFLMTAKSRGCFMRKLRFIGSLTPKKQTRPDACFIIETSKKF